MRQYILDLAAGDGNIPVTHFALALGANPNKLSPEDGIGTPPLLDAVYSNNPRVVQVLLDAGAKPNLPDSQGWVPLMTAAKWDDMNSARLLLAHGADPNAHYHGVSVLDCVKQPSDPQMIAMLKQAGAKP